MTNDDLKFKEKKFYNTIIVVEFVYCRVASLLGQDNGNARVSTKLDQFDVWLTWLTIVHK